MTRDPAIPTQPMTRPSLGPSVPRPGEKSDAGRRWEQWKSAAAQRRGWHAAETKIGGGSAARVARSGGISRHLFLPKNTLTKTGKLLDQIRETT